MSTIIAYFKGIGQGLNTLWTGMKVTGYYFFHARKEIITMQYPDNRDTLKIPERFRGRVVMLHDQNNEHACNGCTMCEMACPNGSIKIITDKILNPETGKVVRIIDKHIYHFSMCTLCNLCVQACPSNALAMDNSYENSVYDRSELTFVLNQPGSKIRDNVKD